MKHEKDIILDEPHRRYNPLNNSWILVSPHREKRPWQGQNESLISENSPQYDPECYLCPGNERAEGHQNPKYDNTFVFLNDFSAVRPSLSLKNENKEILSYDAVAHVTSKEEISLFKSEKVTGRCMVICFSPKHDLTIAKMSVDDIIKIVEVWQVVYRSAMEDPEIKYCQIFENKGSGMGCSNPHPHGQAWMTSVIPEEPAIEHKTQSEYLKNQTKSHTQGLLGDYMSLELDKDKRIIFSNDGFVVLIPYWAVWPFETLIISRRKISRIIDLSENEKRLLAEAISQITIRYDNIFLTNFPYSMGIHQAPTIDDSNDTKPVEHLHFHYFPPLLRSASVRKFQVGFEMLGMPQRDLTPEKAACMLKNVSGTIHYTYE